MIYDSNKKRSIKPKGHGYHQFEKLYIIPWERDRLLCGARACHRPPSQVAHRCWLTVGGR